MWNVPITKVMKFLQVGLPDPSHNIGQLIFSDRQ